MYKIESEKFNGPYELLLKLIESKSLDISEVSLSLITDQFLKYLEKSEIINSEELADFLVVASKLLYIKSKLLLPDLHEDEEDIDDLEKHLKIYKEFLDASKNISKIISNKSFSYAKQTLNINIEKIFIPPKDFKQKQMKKIFEEVLKRLEPIVRLPRAMIEKTISLQEKILELRKFIAGQKNVGFKHILKQSENRSDVIISFLALLELVNQKKVDIYQNNNFDEIIIKSL